MHKDLSKLKLPVAVPMTTASLLLLVHDGRGGCCTVQQAFLVGVGRAVAAAGGGELDLGTLREREKMNRRRG